VDISYAATFGLNQNGLLSLPLGSISELGGQQPDLGLNNGSRRIEGSGRIESLPAFFGAENDVIDLGNSDSIIFAGEGQNVILAGFGDDLLFAGSGRDFINAGNGRNQIYAGDGDNRILAGEDNDWILAGKGNDTIYSGAGRDTIYAGDGNNIINAGTGQDTVWMGAGSDKIILEAGTGQVTVFGFNSATDKLRLGESLLGQSLTFVQQGRDTLVKSGQDVLARLRGVTSGSQAWIDSGPLYRYQATDLGSLSSDPNAAVNVAAINNVGQIVGRYDTGETVSTINGTTGQPQTLTLRQGFIWENGTQTSLPSTGIKNGASDFGAADGATVTLLAPNVNTIDDRGTILGTADEVRQPVTRATDRALVWQNQGSGYQLTINDLGGIESYYFDTNIRQQISGRNIVSQLDAQNIAQTFEKPIYIENGIDNGGVNRVISELPHLGGNGGTAQSLNNRDTIVGYLDRDGALDGGETYTAAVWKRDANGQFILSDLGTFGAEQARLLDINDAGQMIGATNSGSGATATSTPFLLRDGRFTALGSLGGKTGSANALNESGEVVGASQIASGVNHAYVWNGGVQADLNNLVTAPLTYNGAAVTLNNAVGVNDFGDIVATGTYTYKDPATNTERTGTRSFVLKATV
jgi:probable HAF family extracellular repeat protein